MASTRSLEGNDIEYNTIAIAIDKDKNSQGAAKWAVDYLMKGKSFSTVLVHVNTYFSQAYEPTSKQGQAPTKYELQSLFMHYRGFFARKGIQVEEVILNDIDIPRALITFITNHSVGSIVVGASNRNALTRRFKPTDVPTSLGKSAPEHCAVYVISKGKLLSVRSASTHRMSDGSNTSKQSKLWTNSPKSSFKNSVPVAWLRSETPRLSASGPKPLAILLNETDDENTFPSQLLYSQIDFENSLRNGSQRGTRGNEEPERLSSFNRHSIDGTRTSCRLMRSPNVRKDRGNNSQLDGQISMWFDGTSDLSSNRSSFVSTDHSSVESRDSQSSGTASFADDLEVEIKRLRQEMLRIKELYQSLNHQANMTKKKTDELLGQKPEEEYTIEDMKIAKEMTLYVAEIEKLKGKAAMDVARISDRLIEMETRKRKMHLKKKATNALLTGSNTMQYTIYTLEEIEIATNYFSDSLKIGEGGYGPVYKAMLNHTAVAIKVLRPDLSQGLSQFQREIEVLGHMRHPHMVLLLGACPEYGILVYEYMENGSLEDRLFCKDNTPPIPWQTRFKIAAEIATALLFLHETKPEPMVHRDLKPANILLDGNYTSKISDVGLARLIPASVVNGTTQYHMTDAVGTFCYIDPEYQQTGLLGTKSDVYSLGVMLLQLVTARTAMALTHHVEEAIEMGNFADLLDPTIDDWPVEEVLSLAKLALKCCELMKKDRPDLGSVVLPELIRLRDLASTYS